MKIRKANKTDKDSIQTLREELNLFRKKIFSSENKEFHERINPHPTLKENDFDENFFFVAIDEENNIVGFIQGSIDQRKNHKLSKLGYIDELYVKNTFREQGIAKNLFSNLEDEFKRQDCDHLTTHTDIENGLSQQFYLQTGMQKTTVELWKKL